ncbi:Sulfite exporter TauE/SafE [Roseivivax sp. THAF40]|uniref:sulfite exporter TauE/SafE family protein n=1 Tax=unclassified Roseivivax TaxID=2639302 RepID=UPI001268E5DB|nr:MULTISPECIES: sulfite exporter TauE/SafE family protein [unclassified Roseivivax]QFS84225.1 Sulfite exporter TauE/SafE [Roseivivax sp. THAF197b]QFT48053.1 Sulfite exporter TauE/SafE [Roseivivax sp. THAF40]
MEMLVDLLTPLQWAGAIAITLLAGFVKGVVGFAMPMIMISGLGSVVTPELALAALILPTLATNGMQALRQGPQAALGSARRFRTFLIVGAVMLFLSAQLVAILSVNAMFALIGVPIVLFAVAQIAGWNGTLPAGPSKRLEIGIAAFAGFIGGLSGVWGPPVVAYLTALGTEKREQMRIQGVIYGLGALALTVAHVGSGVLNTATVWLSLAMIPPAILGMWLGGQVQDRIDQRAFKRATLWVLLIAGLNLVRRAYFA